MTPKDWTLLVIAQAGARPLQPVQLQKVLFLLGRNLSPSSLLTKQFYTFRPYDYGPFSAKVYEDAEGLETEGLISISRPPESSFNLYRATEAGIARATELKRDLPPQATTYLESAVRFAQDHSFNELVRAIYEAYPDMKANGVFQHRDHVC